jgi:hypothetical protein
MAVKALVNLFIKYWFIVTKFKTNKKIKASFEGLSFQKITGQAGHKIKVH